MHFGNWLIRCAFGQQDDYFEVSPVRNVHDKLPPHLLLNAEWDLSLGPHTWDMQMVLRSHGIPVQSKQFKGNHFNIMAGWDSWNCAVLDTVLNFMSTPTIPHKADKVP